MHTQAAEKVNNTLTLRSPCGFQRGLKVQARLKDGSKQLGCCILLPALPEAPDSGPYRTYERSGEILFGASNRKATSARSGYLLVPRSSSKREPGPGRQGRGQQLPGSHLPPGGAPGSLRSCVFENTRYAPYAGVPTSLDCSVGETIGAVENECPACLMPRNTHETALPSCSLALYRYILATKRGDHRSCSTSLQYIHHPLLHRAYPRTKCISR